MSALTAMTTKNRSGCVGVSLARRKRRLRGGVVVRRWWQATCGERIVRFSIDALGNREAYREAVRCRAEWVRQQAPQELERKAAKKRRNFKTWRERHRDQDRQRQRDYLAANRDALNAKRNARGKAQRAARRAAK